MSFARFENSQTGAIDSENSHSNQAFQPADYWSADARSTQAGGGKSAKAIRVADASDKIDDTSKPLFRHGDLAADDMQMDLRHKWDEAKFAPEPPTPHRLAEFAERAKEAVSNADTEFAQGFAAFERRYQRIQLGIHTFQEDLADAQKKMQPLLKDLPDYERGKVERWMDPKNVWEMDQNTIDRLKDIAATYPQFKPIVRQVERRLSDAFLMFSEMDSIESRLNDAKGPMCNSRDIAETVLTKVGDKGEAKRVHDEFIALHAISSTNLDEAIPTLRTFVDKHSH